MVDPQRNFFFDLNDCDEETLSQCGDGEQTTPCDTRPIPPPKPLHELPRELGHSPLRCDQRSDACGFSLPTMQEPSEAASTAVDAETASSGATRCATERPHAAAWHTHLKAGDKVTALDVREVWCKAVVLDCRGEGMDREFKVHYQGWKRQWDEWIFLRSGRLLPYSDGSTSSTVLPGSSEGSSAPMPHSSITCDTSAAHRPRI